MSFIPSSDFIIEVQKGNVPGHSLWKAMGEREDMGTTATGEDIWRGNDLTPAPTSHTTIPVPSGSGEQMTLVSESANDTSGGTGIRTVKIHFINSTGVEQNETITMNGTSGVNTTATDIIFINDMYAVTKGSNEVAAGNVKIYKTGTVGLVYNMIALGGNKSLVTNRMVPAGHTLYLRNWHCEEAQGKRVTFRIRSTDMYGELLLGVFCFKDVAYLNKTTSGPLDIFCAIPEYSIIKISGWGDVADAEGSCGWAGILVDNAYV